jgi:hypothetical protein
VARRPAMLPVVSRHASTAASPINIDFMARMVVPGVSPPSDLYDGRLGRATRPFRRSHRL